MQYSFDLRDNRHYPTRFRLYPAAVAALEIPERLDGSLAFLAWGVILDYPAQYPDFVALLPSTVQSRVPEPLYLSGWGVVQFQSVTRGSIVVSPFHPRISRGDLVPLTDRHGKAVHFTREWEGTADSASQDYTFDFILEQPYSYMGLSVSSAGPIRLITNPADWVTLRQATDEVEKYGHDLTRSRQLVESQVD